MKKSPAKQKQAKITNENGMKKNKMTDLLKISPSPEVLKIQAIQDNFHKNIQIPISNIQAISHSKTPQRCLQHNTIYTLYCEFDRKPLCANCMYQVDTHRKHRVIPISRSMGLVKQDTTGFEIRLEQNVTHCTTVCRRLEESIIKNETFYPSVINQLKRYYENIVKLLKEKQKQQIEQIKQLHKKLQSQVMYLDHQIKSIINVIQTKLKAVQFKENDDLLLARRNTLEILSKVSKIIHGDIVDVFVQQETHNIVNFSLFNDVYEMVKGKLVITLPGTVVIPRNRAYTSPHAFQKISPKNLKVKCLQDTQRLNNKSPLKQKSVGKKQQKKVKFKFQ